MPRAVEELGVRVPAITSEPPLGRRFQLCQDLLTIDNAAQPEAINGATEPISPE